MTPKDLSFKRYENCGSLFDEINKLMYALNFSKPIISLETFRKQHPMNFRKHPLFNQNEYHTDNEVFKMWSGVPNELQFLRAFSLIPFDHSPKKTVEEMLDGTDEEKRLVTLRHFWWWALGDYMMYESEFKPSAGVTALNSKSWNQWALNPELYANFYNWLMSLAKNPIMRYTNSFKSFNENYWYSAVPRINPCFSSPEAIHEAIQSWTDSLKTLSKSFKWE